MSRVRSQPHFLGAKSKFGGSCLCYCACLKIRAVEMVFVRFLWGSKNKWWGAPVNRGYVAAGYTVEQHKTPLARICSSSSNYLSSDAEPFHAAVYVTAYLAELLEANRESAFQTSRYAGGLPTTSGRRKTVLTALRPCEPLHPSCPGIVPPHHYVFPVDDQPWERPPASPVRRDVGRSLPDE